MNGAVSQVYVGARLMWYGQRVQISKLGAHRVELISDNGTILGTPLAHEVYQAAQRPSSGMKLWMDRDPEEFLKHDLRALEEYRAKYEIVHRVLTGLRPSDPPGTQCPTGMDPRHYDIRERKQALSKLEASKKRTKGKRRGELGDPESEYKQISRLLDRFQREGPMGLINKNRLVVSDPHESDIRGDVNDFMSGLTQDTLRSSLSLARVLRVQLLGVDPTRKLAKPKAIAQYITDWRNGRDHHGGSAKTQRSAANRPVMSPQLRIATRAGELVLFDTTKTNVWVRDPDGGRKPVRLELTIAMDLCTRAIVGMSLTHSTPTVAVALCLADVITPRTDEALREWEGEAPTPYAGCFDQLDFLARVRDPDARGFLPTTIHTDNGSVYVSAALVAMCAYLGISMEQSRAYTPTDKAQIEGWFGDFKKLLEQVLPGFLGGNQYERGAAPEADAALTPGDYELAVRRFVYDYNRRQMDDLHITEDEYVDPYVAVSPIEKWEWSLRRTGSLRMPKYALDPVRLLPYIDLSVDAGRVWCKRLWYRAPKLAELATDPLLLNADGALRVYYDPTDMRQVYVFDRDGGCHPIPWRDRTDFTPRFGLYFVGRVHDFAVTERYDNDRFEEVLADIISRYSFLVPDAPTDSTLSTAERFLASALAPIFQRTRERFRNALAAGTAPARKPTRTKATGTQDPGEVKPWLAAPARTPLPPLPTVDE